MTCIIIVLDYINTYIGILKTFTYTILYFNKIDYFDICDR